MCLNECEEINALQFRTKKKSWSLSPYTCKVPKCVCLVVLLFQFRFSESIYNIEKSNKLCQINLQSVPFKTKRYAYMYSFLLQ